MMEPPELQPGDPAIVTKFLRKCNGAVLVYALTSRITSGHREADGSFDRWNGETLVKLVPQHSSHGCTRTRLWVGGFIGAVLVWPAAAATNVLILPGATWKYLDDGTDQGSAWHAPSFDDSRWASGAAHFGFGDSDEVTVLAKGPTGNQFITYYFRRWFSVTNAADITGLRLGLVRDDGGIVYLNGTNVFRSNLPSGTVGYRTLASGPASDADESRMHYTTVPATRIQEGLNLIAVEVHQAAANSADLSFDLELVATNLSIPPPRLVRGPYLQLGTPTGVTVRWRTDNPALGIVRCGTQQGNLPLAFTNVVRTIDQEVRLDRLLPGTKYYFSVGTETLILAEGESYFFSTTPTNARPTRIWVQGDSGTANENARAVYAAYTNFTGARGTDLWLMLGDNAYSSGTDAQYQAAVFDMFPELLRNTVLWSTIGNHETYSATNGIFPYLDIFNLPKDGAAGGVPSGTERYYSFDFGHIHLVCLDAMTSDRGVAGPMCTWLEADLEANDKDWTIAFWHHPPYTKGSHDSDREIELIEMRRNVVPILEAFGVDLVLCGHSHGYERSYYMHGHYGNSDTFDETLIVQPGSGRADDTGEYVRITTGSEPRIGTVFIVAGSSGLVTPGPLNHPAMFHDELELGSLVIDVERDFLEVKFLRETGAIDDRFTIRKGQSPPALRAVIASAENGTLTIIWSAQPGARYRVERLAALPGEWLSASGTITATTLTATWLAQFDDAPSGFFRVVRLP